MKILLSAYACEPGKGSEPGVGWHWAQEIAGLGHEVWVLTRANNRPAIEQATANSPLPNVHFVYYDLPHWLKAWKKGTRGVHFYYFLWQIGAFFKARRLAQSIRFDWVHHITFVSIHQPSFMGLLGIPFIFGPVAGGERVPLALRKGYSRRGKIVDMLRDIWSLRLGWDPLMWMTFWSARQIAVTSTQTLALIPRLFQDKCRVQLAIGAECEADSPVKEYQAGKRLKIIFAGNLLDLKGIHLALSALAELQAGGLDSCFTVVGSGPQEARLKQLSDQLGLTDMVNWIPSMNKPDLMALYRQHDVLLFPSLRDSGGMVVLEAMGQGLPAIVLNMGGPGNMVNEHCGFRIDTSELDQVAIIQKMAEALQEIAKDSNLYRHLSDGALQRVQELSWRNQVKMFYEALPPMDSIL